MATTSTRIASRLLSNSSSSRLSATSPLLVSLRPISRLPPTSFAPSLTLPRHFSSSPASRLSLWPFSTASPAKGLVREDAAPEQKFDDSEAVASSIPSTATPSEPLASTPAPPVDAVPEAATPVADAVQTFVTSSGLPSGTLDLTHISGLSPIMRLQSLFINLHESFPFLGYTPWYIAIPLVTLILRSLLFYFNVRSQQNAAKMAVIQPQMLANMAKLKEAKAVGDVRGVQAAQVATATLMKEHKVNPLKSLVFPLAQAAVFMCMFFALRGLGNADIPSMMNEGFGWVQDLTKADPYYVLPVLSTGLTLLTLETGVDSSTQVQTAATKNMKAAFRIALVVSLPFIAQFPAVLLTYWTVNNFISLVQAQVLKLPFVRTFFNIPIPPPKAQPGEPGYIKEPGFMESFKAFQNDFSDRVENSRVEQEKRRIEKEAWEKAREGRKATVIHSTAGVKVDKGYRPRAEKKEMKVLEEIVAEPVVAEPVVEEIKEQVREMVEEVKEAAKPRRARKKRQL